MPLFEAVALKKKDDKEELIVGPVYVTAKDLKGAKEEFLISMAEELVVEEDEEREILVRPF